MVRMALRMAGHVSGQMEILRLLKYPVFAEVLSQQPRMPFKFAADDYLLRGLSVAQRKACFVHHYNWLREAFPEGALRQILQSSLPIFEIQDGESVFRIVVYLSKPFDKEGELSFDLEVDGMAVYVVSFTIVPGAIVESEASDVVLISRLQGVRGMFEQIRRVTRALHDVAPASMLLAALQGLAEAFGFRAIVSTTAERQASYTGKSGREFFDAYDAFFHEVGIDLGPAGLFHCPIPIPEKPMSEVKRGHKLRTKEKRAFKREVSAAVREFFLQNCRIEGGRARAEQTVEEPVQLPL
jgi:uncharacterized protein VirK/YbjX